MRNQSLVCSLMVIGSAIVGAGACAHEPLSKHDEIQVSLRYQNATLELTQSMSWTLTVTFELEEML